MITAICPTTASRNRFIPMMIRCFDSQFHTDSELLVVSEDQIQLPAHPRVRFVACPPGLSLGAKRNFCCAAAAGDVIYHWDSDDWYAPHHLSTLSRLMVSSAKPVVGYHRLHFMLEDGSAAWIYATRRDGMVSGNSLMYRKDWWKYHPFADISIGEDSDFVMRAVAEHQTATTDGLGLAVAMEHSGNTWKRDHSGPHWEQLNDRDLKHLRKICRTH